MCIKYLVSSHSVGGRPVHGTATTECDDTRRGIIQFLPPDDNRNIARNM